MDINAKKMACGNCGCSTYKLFMVDTRIAAECQNCKDISYIQPKPAELEITSGENSSGCLAVFDGEDI
jgi:hypothetical protein